LGAPSFEADKPSCDSLAALDFPRSHETAHDEKRRDATGVGQSLGNQEPVETALEAAPAAGRWDVAQLAKELEARRLAREPNVLSLSLSRAPKDRR
jgi:hypothetical protein